MEKTLTDSDLEQRLNRGLIVEQRGLEEGGWRIGLGDKLCCAPTPPPHYIGGQEAPWPAKGGVESLWDSYSQRESFPPGNPTPKWIAILLGVGLLPYGAPP